MRGLVDKPLFLTHLREKKKSLLFFLLSMLVFKDQQRESVIFIPKDFKELASSTVLLLIHTGRCVGV